MTAWHDRRVGAAARALTDAGPDADEVRRAEAVVSAADRAVGGVVPREDYEQLALDFSAWRVRALQTDQLLQNTLETLDRIASTTDPASANLRDLASAAAIEVRALLDSQRESEDASGLE